MAATFLGVLTGGGTLGPSPCGTLGPSPCGTGCMRTRSSPPGELRATLPAGLDGPRRVGVPRGVACRGHADEAVQMRRVQIRRVRIRRVYPAAAACAVAACAASAG